MSLLKINSFFRKSVTAAVAAVAGVLLFAGGGVGDAGFYSH
jgi:hypothetical protein